MMKFNHFGILTSHPMRMLNFYIKKLGFKKEYQTILPKEVIYPIFRIPEACAMVKLGKFDIGLEIFWFENYRPNPNTTKTCAYNHIGVEVENKEKFCKRLADKFRVRVIKVSRGSHYAYFIQDPDKNLIEIKQENRLRR